MKKLLVSIGILATLQGVAQSSRKTVAQDGSGDYTTVQQALNAVPMNNKKKVTIFIKKGVYKEKLVLDSSKNFVTLVGENKFTTILTYDDHSGKLAPNGDTVRTPTSYSFYIKANDFEARNLTFDNNAGFTAGQAVAVMASGDRMIFRDCRFTGNQDVLFTPPSKSIMRIVISKALQILYSVRQRYGLRNAISIAKRTRM
jgi:pectinesterase